MPKGKYSRDEGRGNDARCSASRRLRANCDQQVIGESAAPRAHSQSSSPKNPRRRPEKGEGICVIELSDVDGALASVAASALAPFPSATRQLRPLIGEDKIAENQYSRSESANIRGARRVSDGSVAPSLYKCFSLSDDTSLERGLDSVNSNR